MENNFFEKSIVLKLGSNAIVVGYLTIVFGSLNVLFVLGLILLISKVYIASATMTFGVLYVLALLGSAIRQIFVGTKAKTTGESFRDFSYSNDDMIEQMSITNLTNYFTITKILYIVNISLYVLVIIFSKSGLFKQMIMHDLF